MRSIYFSFVSLLFIGAAHQSEAAQTSNTVLMQLVSGDGLDADAAATGNSRTGGMWAGATHHDMAYGYPGQWQTGPRHWTTYRHHLSPRWYWR